MHHAGSQADGRARGIAGLAQADGGKRDEIGRHPDAQSRLSGARGLQQKLTHVHMVHRSMYCMACESFLVFCHHSVDPMHKRYKLVPPDMNCTRERGLTVLEHVLKACNI